MSEAIAGQRDQRRLLILVLILFTLKAIVAFWIIPAFQQQIGAVYGIGTNDNYELIAQNLRLGLGYRITPETSLTLMREPGYPLFLAALSYLFGPDLRVVIAANLVLSSLSAFLISRLARYICPESRVALIAPVLFLIHPGVAVAELRSGVEIPFIFLLLCFFLVLRRALQSEKPSRYALAGLVLGLACSVRSTVLLFPPFLLLYHLWRERSWAALRRSAARAALMMLTLSAVISPWVVRNYLLVHKFVPTASVQGVSMQVGYYQCVHGGSGEGFHDMEVEAAQVRVDAARAGGYRFIGEYYQYFFDPNDEVRFNSSLQQQVLQSYRQSPALFIKCASENVVNFWFTGKNRLATLGGVLVQVPYLFLALMGLIMGFRRSERPIVFCMFLFALYSIAVCAPIHAEARYSVPLVPILAIFAAIPLSRLVDRLRDRKVQPGSAAA
jgi:4-amino-4-deoxy-L-arabinose transferase-like glycosyltransferase